MNKPLKFFCLLTLILSTTFISSQNKKEGAPSAQPKLVIGIVVDQMRNDYIERYWNRFGTGGFRRLIHDGYYFRNAHYNYVPTYTGPGHASIYTGTTPRMHGIIANDWYSKKYNLELNCVGDSTTKSIGGHSKHFSASPKNLLSTTIGDEMKMASNQKSKVFAIALKDRSAVLPAGHRADGVYWMDETSGEFISTSWYADDLPRWLKNFNDDRLTKAYLEKWWSTLYPIETYTNSIADENKFEASQNNKEFPVFPYEYKSYIDKGEFSIIKTTPFGNSITKDLAIECIIHEELGKDVYTDLLCLSFSSTDIIGHAFGPRSVEIEDAYLRLDKDIEALLNRLDKEVGKSNYTVFLTADHGASDVPNHMLQNQIPAGYFKTSKLNKELKSFVHANYGDSSLILNISNDQIFLNEKKIVTMRLSKDDFEDKICQFLLTLQGVAEAYPSKVLKYESFNTSDLRSLLQNGYNHKLSGNVCFLLKPGWMEHGEKGTTHGSGYNYDTHVPVVFYGAGVTRGESFDLVNITQIAPTVCELLKINQTNSSYSEILRQVFAR